MAIVGTADKRGRSLVVAGVAGVNAGDVLIDARINRYDVFQFRITAGAADVYLSYDDGVTYDGPLSLADLESTSTAPVVVMAPARNYGARISAQRIQVRQNGAVACTGAQMNCDRWGNN